jgi:hypothetical protein
MRKIYHKLPLSSDHLEAAILFAFQARELEAQRVKPLLFEPLSEIQSAAMACTLSTVAYLEATINEFFSDVIDEIARPGVDVDPGATNRFKKLWKLGVPKSSVLDKYDTALALCDRSEFSKGAPPYQPVALLVKLRNALTHFAHEWQPGGGWPHEDAELAKLSKSLRTAFPENRLVEPSQPYFPYRCLGYGSSKWGIISSVAFVTDFRMRLGLGFSPTYILPKVNSL